MSISRQALDLERRLAAVQTRRAALADLLSKARGHNRALVEKVAAMSAARDSLSSQLAVAKADLQAVDARILALAGPALADGRYIGRVFAAANTNPPRLAFVVASTVESSETAAHGWRVLEVAPDATVRFHSWRNLGSRTVAFPWFVHVFNSSDVRDAGMRGDTRYWVKVTNGLVTTIGEQW